MSDKEEYEVTDETFKEEAFAHSFDEADQFQSTYVEDDEDEKDEIRRYKEKVDEMKKQHRPKKVLKWKDSGIIALEISVFFWKFVFLYLSIFYIGFLFGLFALSWMYFINTLVLTAMLYLFKQWWKC